MCNRVDAIPLSSMTSSAVVVSGDCRQLVSMLPSRSLIMIFIIVFMFQVEEQQLQVRSLCRLCVNQIDFMLQVEELQHQVRSLC